MRFRSASQVLILKHVIVLVKVKIRQKKTILRFINRKHGKKALINGKGLININKSSRSLSSSANIFINENLTPMNNKIVFHCRKVTRDGQIDKTCSRDGVMHIASSNIRDGKVIKILPMSMLVDIFPDFDFDPDAREEKHNESLQLSC